MRTKVSKKRKETRWILILPEKKIFNIFFGEITCFIVHAQLVMCLVSGKTLFVVLETDVLRSSLIFLRGMCVVNNLFY